MDFEQLGLFYLGRRADPDTHDVGEVPLLYDSADLVTHAVIVGMTGSGKTGLGIGLIEEAAIDGLPVIAIDPKGDLPNLMLTFPGLTASEFAPWVNEQEARAVGQDREAVAQHEADRWARGLAEWGQDGRRVERFKHAADFALYTPGSATGRQLSIVRSFAAPSHAVVQDAELLAERVATAATSVLTLAGMPAEPMRSREHILIATLLGEAWRASRDLDLPALIAQVQTPPLTRVGVLELEAFYPAAQRFALAVQLNNLLAAPGFEAWLQGEPLDIDRLLYTADARPRVSIVTLAHLNDAQRMFFVALLLNELLAWMRAQRGTSSLRALVYFDELVGFLPPVANPPSKAPLLRLLKQARAVGLGCVLSTQNPVDLDYKALANAGTWMLGRLQTERDKARVLEGLEGAAAAAGAGLDRARMDTLLSGLQKRMFLLHNVHDREPIVFQTRWTLSYLRGPLGRDEIRRLAAEGHRETEAADGAAAHAGDGSDHTSAAAVPSPAPAAGARNSRVADALASHPAPPELERDPVARANGRQDGPVTAPVLAPDIVQYFAPGDGAVWTPVILGSLRLEYADAKLGIDETSDVTVFTPVISGPLPVDWEHATLADFSPADLSATPATTTRPFAPLPSKATQAKSYVTWSKALARWAARSQGLELRRCRHVGLTSRADESAREFALRVQIACREARDAAVGKVREKFRPKLATLDAKIRRAEQMSAREAEQATDSKVQAGVSVAATIFGALLGRKAVTASTLGRATTAARGMSRMGREAADVSRAQDTLATLEAQRAALGAEAEDAMQAVAAEFVEANATIETVVVKPRRGGVSVQLLALVWMPEG
ncbi:MAG: ATP-binding protein [Vicinamibacterales bacterium]